MQMISIKTGIPFLTLCLSAVILTTTITCQTTKHRKNIVENVIGSSNYRLPKNVVPVNYDLGIIIFETVNLLHCKCVIDILVIKETSFISLHSRYLNEKDVNIQLASNDYVITPNHIHHNNDTDILNIYFDMCLSPNPYVLTIMYDYKPQKNDKVLFKTIMSFLRYNDGNTSLSIFSTLMTNIHPAGARQWFPCWDEPSFRTTFQINLLFEDTYNLWPSILSTSHIHDNVLNWKWESFNISQQIPASSVMIALVSSSVARYNVLSSARSANTTDSAIFTNNVIKMIKQSKWYGIIPASNVKLEQNTIPFMQHDIIRKWSIIIYREILVVYDERADSSVKKLDIARTVTYSMVHQAIDNSYGLLWWNDLWLKEGLAMLLHAEILNETFPKWRYMDIFMSQIQYESLQLDGYSFMKPLEQEVKSSSEIKSLFSYPIYVKAPAIMHMIKHTVGTYFQKLIKTFFHRYVFIQPISLWATMANQLKKDMHDVAQMIDNWIKKTYTPYVQVERFHKNGVTAQLVSPSVIDNAGNITQPTLDNWWIPITWTTMDKLNFTKTVPQRWLNPKNSSIAFINILHDSDWVIINIQRIGHYRVFYDTPCFKPLVQYLGSPNYAKIHVLNRAQIIDDTYYFWRKGNYTYKDFKEVIQYLSQETDYVAWYPMFQIFRDLVRFYPFPESKFFKNDFQSLLTTLLAKLTYEEKSGEDDIVKWLRQEAARWACTFDAPECLREANRLLNKHINSSSEVLTEWRMWIYCNGVIEKYWKLEDLRFYISKPFIFNYHRCLRKPATMNRYLLYIIPELPRSNTPIYFSYKIIVEYSLERIDDIWYIFRRSLYSLTLADEVKLLYIIITRDYNWWSLKSLKTSIEMNLRNPTAIECLLNVIKKQEIKLRLTQSMLSKLFK